jgi:Amiloride-sensitive sodium channel
LLLQLVKYFAKFIKTSDMHGMNYTQDQTIEKVGRVFWALLVLLSLTICTVLVIDMNRHAEKSPISTRIDPKMRTLDDVSKNFPFSESKSLDSYFCQIPFPAVMIGPKEYCIKYWKDKLCYYYGECENIIKTEFFFKSKVVNIFQALHSSSGNSLEFGDSESFSQEQRSRAQSSGCSSTSTSLDFTLGRRFSCEKCEFSDAFLSAFSRRKTNVVISSES